VPRRPTVLRVSRCLARSLVVGVALLVGLSAAGQQSRGAAPGRKTAFVSEAPLAAEPALSAKLDPLLRRLVRDHAKRAPLAWAIGSETTEPLIRTETVAVGQLAAGVFVKTTNVAATTAAIRALGGYVRVEAGDILVAVVPVSSLETLAATTEVSSIEASQYSKTQLDVSRAATKADLVQAGTGVTARTGAGVVVGIVDSGIDYTRPDFITSGGSTRIRSIWDISGVAAGGNARICTSAEINAATCAERDLNGHGTHVAGISAGGGRTQAGFVGMAPGADIIAAKATRATDASGSFPNDDVVAAISYIFQQAQALGKPAVVNLSLGATASRPLDGTSNYEQAISNLTGPGKIVVAAAGNDGSTPIHLSYGVQGSSYADSLETPWVPASDNSSGHAYLWYGTGSISVGIAVRTTSTQDTGVLISAPIGPGQSTAVLDLTDGAGTVLAHYQIDASTTSYPSNGAHYVSVMLQPVESRYFSLYTLGSGTFDAWANNMTFGTRTDTYWMPGDWQKTIGSPGTATKVITVGAYTTKKQWTDINATTWTITSSWCGSSFTDTLGDIACFSSRGPTRDGRTKPDITAPGHRIASDLSVDSLPNHLARDQMQGGKLLMESGTSQATPHITGIVALMLQSSPLLTYDTALQALQNTATKDSFTGTGANNTWGAGKVNALEVVQAVTTGGGPVPNFTFTPPSPSAGQTVQFTDTSTGGPTSWSWDFGDGFSSTAQSPTHAFATAGAFAVALTVGSGSGSNTATKTVTVSQAGASSCLDDATTMCIVGGRYRIRSHWRNQYAGGALSTLSNAKLTDATSAFWIADSNTYEYLIRIQAGQSNGRSWIAIPTFTDVEFWIDVTDTHTGQSKEYHSDAGNRTLLYDPYFFVFP
jgi:minor extracellular serine protease Vpr